MRYDLKKFISVILAVCITAGMCAYNNHEVYSAEVNTKTYYCDSENGIEYYIYGDYAEIVKFINVKPDPVSVPAEVNGVKVTAVRTYFPVNAKAVIIPESISEIADYAFDFCTALEKTEVDEDNKFYSSADGILFNKDKSELICYPAGKKDERFTVPEYVGKISPRAFITNTRLQNIAVSDDNKYYTVKDGVLFNKDKTEIIRYPGGKNGREYIIPDSVSVIGAYAFCCNYQIVDIEIPESVTYIGDGAFSRCSSLLSVTIPEKVTVINDDLFYKCSDLKDVSMPETLKSIGKEAFSCCFGLNSVVIPDNVSFIGESAFSSCTNLSSVTLPSSLSGVSEQTFFSCVNLDKITLPDQIEKIDSYAFSECKKLKSVIVPDSVNEIEMNAFTRCDSIESVTILNPDCELSDPVLFKSSDIGANDPSEVKGTFDVVIYGYADSTVQKYAEEYGYKFSALKGNPKAGSSSSGTVGDVNNDGSVNSVDYVVLANRILNLSSDEKAGYDINNDGKTDVNDLVVLRTLLRS